MSNLLNLIAGEDIEQEEVIQAIAQQLNSARKPLYLTATLNIRDIRKESPVLKPYLRPYYLDSQKSKREQGRESYDSDANLFSFHQFEKFIAAQVHYQGHYLSPADQKQLLAYIINHYETFAASAGLEPHLQRSFYELRHELFKLFEFLHFYQVQELSPNILDHIQEKHSHVERGIFAVYNTYTQVLQKIVQGLRHNNLLAKELPTEILRLLDGVERSRHGFDTYQNKIKEHMQKAILAADKVFIDGFLFFNDWQKFIISIAVKEQKPVYLVAKFSSSDRASSFLYEDNYLALAKELGQELGELFSEDGEYSSQTALAHAKMKYPEYDMRISREITDKIRDGSINIFKPLFNRDDELYFVATQISKLAQKELKQGKTVKEVQAFITQDVCIVMAMEKEKYENRLGQILQEVGVFVRKKKLEINALQLSRALDENRLPEIVFSKQEFLKIPFVYLDGVEVTYEDKLILFQEAYTHIEIEKKERPISSYPIGQFVLHLYQIINKGMKVEGFKLILYSNWDYVIRNHREESAKWDRYISDFKSIEMYFESKHSLAQWQDEMKRIVLLKEEMRGQEIRRWHPFQQIELDSLKFFIGMLEIIDNMIQTILSVEGSVTKHIEILRTKIITVENIMVLGADKWDFEQRIVARLNTAVQDIGNRSLVHIDATVFAENIKAMLTDWEKEREDENEEAFRVSVVNLENMKKYKYTYFCMLEANKYPRTYQDDFPYTSEIIEILGSDDYGIQRKPSDKNGLEYHLKLEQYLFKNVMEFTTEVLNLTYTEREDNQIIKPSIYLEDICTLFNVDLDELILKDHGFCRETTGTFAEPDIPPLYLTDDDFRITELGTFLLCPRLYVQLKHNNQQEQLAYGNRFQLKFYAEAVFYSRLLEVFVSYSQSHHKVYSVHDDECFQILETYATLIQDEVFKYFSFLTDYEKKDIRSRVLHKTEGFISYIISQFKKPFFALSLAGDEYQRQGGYTFCFDNALKIIDAENPRTTRRFLYEKYLDFLTLKTVFPKNSARPTGAPLKTNQELIQELDNPTEKTDRVFIATRLVENINTFFERSVGSHVRGAVTAQEIAARIQETDFAIEDMKTSKFCDYCIVSEVCKGKYYQTGEEDNGIH